HHLRLRSQFAQSCHIRSDVIEIHDGARRVISHGSSVPGSRPCSWSIAAALPLVSRSVITAGVAALMAGAVIVPPPPALRPARPCTAAAAAASRPRSWPEVAARAPRMPASTSPDPAVAIQGEPSAWLYRAPSGHATSVTGPL